jgi:hypothetical protein
VRALLIALALLVGACTASPCSFRNVSYAEHVAACDARIGDECKLDENRRPVADCPALVECKAWARETCGGGAQ